MQTQTGDDLMARILARPVDDQVRGQAANDLLNELFGGYPVENLRALLHSGDDDAVQTGAWLLSELGEQAAPLLEEVPTLLAHPRLQVRFFAVEFVLLAADERHAGIIAQALALSRASDSAIRWKVLHFLAMASTEQLMAGLSRLDDPEVGRLTAGLWPPRTPRTPTRARSSLGWRVTTRWPGCSPRRSRRAWPRTTRRCCPTLPGCATRRSVRSRSGSSGDSRSSATSGADRQRPPHRSGASGPV